MGKQCYYCEKSHCKLDTCSTCDDEAILYCSKECQISSWWKIHKYTCSGGKYKFLEGCDVTIKNLESRPEFNGQVATVESFSKEEGTFDVNFEDLREDMKGLAPKNLDSNCKYSLVRINAKTLNPKDITHIEIFQNDFKKFHQNLNSLFHMDTEDSWLERGTFLLWCEDDKKHYVKMYFDEKGKHKSLVPNHRANAMIDAGRFSTKDFDNIDNCFVDNYQREARNRNQDLKESWGSNYLVGDVICVIPNRDPLPDFSVFGENPIDFITAKKTPCDQMKSSHGEELAMKMVDTRMKKVGLSSGMYTRHDLALLKENRKWEFVDYHVMPKVGVDNGYKELLRSWGISC
jgi:hypothetical protein